MSFAKSLWIFLGISIITGVNGHEEYHEELYIKPLLSGHINTYFQFTTRWKLEAGESLYHTHLMPRAVAEILQTFDTREFHLSLTQGLWRYESWGYPVVDAAPGAEVWAWFSGNLTENDVNQQWKNLCSTMAGILCTSLNFIDKTNSVEPKYSFRPTFGTVSKSDKSREDKFIRYATLPREIVCTENLTPWKKLLPCNTVTGLASLLNSGHVHNTNYHSLNVAFRTLCDSTKIDEGCVLEVVETANFIYDMKILGSNEFSIRKMFGQGLNGICPLAKTSKIYVDVTANDYDLSVEPTEVIISKRGGVETNYAVFDVRKESPVGMFNIAWTKRDKKDTLQIAPAPPVSVHRYILGHGQERGKVVTKIRNTHWSSLDMILQENIPWYVPSYMHTLTIKEISDSLTKNIIKPKLIHYIPGQQREKPYHLEIAFTIPQKSTLEISFDFDYTFLKWLEYPPDANHGHYLGSAILTTQLPIAKTYVSIPVDGYLFSHTFNASKLEGYFLQIRTESLILSLPTPDFSMPYNVICLACTVVALAFGPIHSVATKKMIIDRRGRRRSLIEAIKTKILGLFRKKTVNDEETNEEEKTTSIEESKKEK